MNVRPHIVARPAVFQLTRNIRSCQRCNLLTKSGFKVQRGSLYYIILNQNSREYSSVALIKETDYGLPSSLPTKITKSNVNNKDMLILSFKGASDPWKYLYSENNLLDLISMDPKALKLKVAKITTTIENDLLLNERILLSTIKLIRNIQSFRKKLLFPGIHLADSLVKNPGLMEKFILNLVKDRGIIFALNIYLSLLEASIPFPIDRLERIRLALHNEIYSYKDSELDALRFDLANSWNFTKLINPKLNCSMLYNFFEISPNMVLELIIKTIDNGMDLSIFTSKVNNSIMVSLIRHQDFEGVGKWLSINKKFSFPKDLNTLNIRLHYFTKTRNFKEFINTLNEIRKSHICDTVTCNTLLSSLKVFSSSDLNSIVLKILQECSFRPNSLTPSIVYPLLNVLKDDELNSYLKSVVLPQFDPSLFTVQVWQFKYHLSKLTPQDPEFQKILNMLKNSTIKSPIYKYSCVIHQLLSLNLHDEAEDILTSLINSYGQATIQVMTSFIQNYLQQGFTSKASDKLSQMMRLGHKPNTVTIQQVIVALHKGGFPIHASEVLNTATRLGFIPTRHVINTHLDYLVKDKDRLPHGLAFYRKWQRAGFTPDTCTFNILLRAALAHRQPNTVRTILKEMEGRKIPFDQTTYSELLKGAYYGLDHPKAKQFYQSLISSNLTLDDRVKFMIGKYRRILL